MASKPLAVKVAKTHKHLSKICLDLPKKAALNLLLLHLWFIKNHRNVTNKSFSMTKI